MEIENRRPIASRGNPLIVWLAKKLAMTNISPNQISVASVFCCICSALCMIKGGSAFFILAALFIQLRLLCNLIDGMVAVEGGKRSVVGEIYNEIPDRISDTILFVAAGYAFGSLALGWAASCFAALTAYARVFGGSVGIKQRFLGPMAKQHRMALLTFSLLICAFYIEKSPQIIYLSLLIIAIGSAITFMRRISVVHQDLKEANHE